VISKNREDYLKAIFVLSAEKNRTVKTKELAHILGVSSASVTEMIRKLVEDGLVENEPYHGFSLTKSGITRALYILRKHRLLEKFLVETLGLPKAQVHAQAHRLEHVVSDELLDRIDCLLKSPCYCPHESRIPSKDTKVASLADLQPDSEARLVFSKLRAGKILDRLNSMGLVPDARIRVLRKLRKGPMLIMVKGSEIALDKSIASQFYVEVYS